MKISFSFLLILLTLTISVSCIKEQEPSPKLDRDNVSVTFKTLLSGNTQVMSKTLTEAQENEIQEIEVLAFEQSGDDYLFSYRASGTDITPVEGAIEFTVNLKPYDNRQILLIVANAKTCIESMPITQNMDINDLLPLLVFAKDEEFKSDQEDQFSPIPMYAKTSAIQISNSTTNIGTHHLIRMLARVDITSEASGFKLVNAAIYNRKNKGYIAYSDELWNAGLERVTAAYVPVDAVSKPDPSVSYLAESEAITRSIYTFEAKGVSNPMNATAIIVGGYAGFPENSTLISYYRIDIPQFTGGVAQANTCGDILRNHLYKIQIAAVSTIGSPSIEEAFTSGYRQLDASITAWDQNTKIDIDINKPISIQLDRSGFKYDGVGTKTRELTFTAEGNWTASTNQDWLEIKTHTIDDHLHTITYTIDPLVSGSDRLAYIDLRAGNFVKKVSIDQYVGPAIRYTPEAYLLNDGLDYQLSIKAKAPWTSTLSNPSNAIKKFEVESEEGNDGSLEFSFKDQKGVFSASVSIASIDGEFDPYIVPLHAVGAYDFEDLDILIYPVDQARDLTWYVYSNTPDNRNHTYIPPTDIRADQVSPPRENSCACLKPSKPGKPWRLPLINELTAIYGNVKIDRNVNPELNPWLDIHYDFQSRCWYFSAESGSSSTGWAVGFSAAGGSPTNPNVPIPPYRPHYYTFSKNGSYKIPDDAFYGARCVRDK